MSTKPKETDKTIIYVLKDPDTLEVRYVGKTAQTLICRLGGHISEAKRRGNETHKLCWINNVLNRNKLPIAEQIDECSWEDSANLEIFYIAKYKEQGCKLVNETIGGEGNLGREVSEDTRQKIKEAQRKKLPKVYQYDLNGNLIKEWENAPVAAETLGIKVSGITRCLRKERFKYKEFIWTTKLSDNANQEYIKNRENQLVLNKTKNKGGYTQSILAKLISNESRITKYYYVYDSEEHTVDHLLYEGVSAKDIMSYINNCLGRQDIGNESTATRTLQSGKPYYNRFYLSNESPTGYINTKKLAFIIIMFDKYTLYGVEDAAKFFKVTKTNIINNIKGNTKTLNTEEFGKITLKNRLNKEHCRLYEKTYGLSLGEIEEALTGNIELTD